MKGWKKRNFAEEIRSLLSPLPGRQELSFLSASWTRIPLDMLTVFQYVKKITALKVYYCTHNSPPLDLIYYCRHNSPPLDLIYYCRHNSPPPDLILRLTTEATPSHPTFLRSILMFSSQICLMASSLQVSRLKSCMHFSSRACVIHFRPSHPA